MKAMFMRIFHKYREIIVYIIVGGMTTVVSMVLFYGSVWTFLDGTDAVQLQAANILSWCGAVLFAYVTNRIWVFQSKEPGIVKEFGLFAASRGLTLLLDMAVMFVLSTLIGIDCGIAKLISMVLVTIGNYVISKFFVFRN